MPARWHNWSRSVSFEPARHLRPRDADELAAIVREAHARGGQVRVVGAGHSSNGILVGEDTLVSLEHMTGVVHADRARCEARVRAGSTLQALGRARYGHDLALPNYGDIATQTIGGAIGTGTHGAGLTQPNLSAMLIGGTLGVFTEFTLALVPAFDVERREYACGTDAALAHLDALVAENRSFDFYWYPRRDDVKLRLVNPVGGGVDPHDARLLTKTDGYGHHVIPTHTGIPHRFEESEYALPADAGVACFRAVRERVLARWRHLVGWRLLYRTVRSDDADLSPEHGRDTVTISLHQNSTLPWRDYFADIEPIFLAHGGRPHWAKKHNQTAESLASRYPRWSAFARVREVFDPEGVLLTPYLRTLLGVGA